MNQVPTSWYSGHRTRSSVGALAIVVGLVMAAAWLLLIAAS